MTRHCARGNTILMIAYTYYESDPRVIREAEAAVGAGFEVDFLASRRAGNPSTEVIRGVRVIRLNQVKYRGDKHYKYVMDYMQFFLRCFIRTTYLFLKRRYRVIHVNNMPDFLVFCTFIPRLFGAKVILDIHDPMPNTFASKFKVGERGLFFRLLLWQERMSAAYCSRVITVSHPIRDAILVKHGLASDSIEVIANFADDNLFPLRKSFSIEGKVRFAFHGTIHERSGLRMVMSALSKVRHRDRISMKIIGEGDFSESLKEIIQSLHLEDVVEFDNRIYPADAICGQIDDCNLGLVPLEISSITNYALPLKMLEYISLGLPVVAVRNEAISYYFGEEDYILFDWNDPNSLSAAMDRIAENPEALMGYRERSVNLRERFSWTGEKEKYVALLHQLFRRY